MYYRLGGGNIKTGVFKSQNTLAKGAVTCTVYPLGATVKFSLLSAPSAWKWGSLALSSLFPSPLALSQPIPLLVPVLARYPAPLTAPVEPPQHQPRAGEMPPTFLRGRRDIKGTKPLPHPCPASAPLPSPSLHHGKLCPRGEPRPLAQLHMPGASCKHELIFCSGRRHLLPPSPILHLSPSSRIVTAAQETPGKASRTNCCVSLLPSYPPARTN